MIRPLRRRTRRTPAEDPEINRALEAMSAPELRAAVHAGLDGLDADVKAHIIDTLIVRATKASSGWGPSRPSQRIIDEAKSFAEAARRTGSADPDDASEHLRRATKAFHAGDHASALRSLTAPSKRTRPTFGVMAMPRSMSPESRLAKGPTS